MILFKTLDLCWSSLMRGGHVVCWDLSLTAGVYMLTVSECIELRVWRQIHLCLSGQLPFFIFICIFIYVCVCVCVHACMCKFTHTEHRTWQNTQDLTEAQVFTPHFLVDILTQSHRVYTFMKVYVHWYLGLNICYSNWHKIVVPLLMMISHHSDLKHIDYKLTTDTKNKKKTL